MSVSASITVSSNRLPSIASQLGRRVVDAINEALLNADEASIPVTPIEFGLLRSNKTFDYASGGKHSGELTWNQEFAIYQDQGTSHIPANEFAQAGIDAATPQFLSAMKNLGLR